MKKERRDLIELINYLHRQNIYLARKPNKNRS